MASPYAPPSARVSDVLVQSFARPHTVTIAVACMWVSVATGAIVVGMNAAEVLSLATMGALPMFVVVVNFAPTVINIALLTLVAVKVAAGRKWALWLYIALYGFGAISLGAVVAVAPDALAQMTALQVVSAIFNWTIQTAALALLFVRPSRQWFAALKA